MLRNTIIAGLFLLLVTPLVVVNSLFFPFITGKAFFFRLIVECLVAMWIVLAFLDQRYRPRRSAVWWAVTGFTLIVSLATVFGINPYRSFWSNFERMEGLITYLHLLGLFVVAGAVLDTEKLWRWFFRSSVAVSVVVAGYGVLQLLGKIAISQGYVRVDGTFGNATYLAVYLLIHLFLAVWLWVGDWAKRWSPVVYGPIIILELLVLYHTATRGAAIGLLLGTIVAAGIIVWRSGAAVRRWALLVLAVVIVLIGGFWLARDSSFVSSSPVLSRFASISATDQTADARLTIWRMTLRGVKERPVLGWGPENFLQVFSKYYEPKLWRQEPWFDHPHNIYLDWLINAGVLGLAGYLSLFVVLFYYLWRREKDYLTTAIFTGLLVGYGVNNFFVFDNLISYILFFSLLAYCHHRYATPKNITVAAKISWPLSPKQNVVGVLVLILLVSTVYFLNWRPLRVAHNLLLSFVTPNNPTAGLVLFKQIFTDQTFGSAEAVGQLFNQAWVVGQSNNVDAATKQAFFDLSLTESQREIKANPQDIRTTYVLGSFLLSTGNPLEAIPYLTKAHELSPNKQSILADLGLAYFNSGNKIKGLELAKEAYDLDSRFPNVRLTYALLLLADGQYKRAEEVAGDTALDTRFIGALVEAKQYNKVLELWQKKVALEPDNSQFRFSLAAAYYVTGNHERAIKELTTVLRSPTSSVEAKTQAETTIKKIHSGKNPLVQ